MKTCLKCGTEYTTLCYLCLEIKAYKELHPNKPPILWPTKNWETVKGNLMDWDRDYIEARVKI